MFGSVFLRKVLFRAIGRPVLMDPSRNAVYRWAWTHLKSLPVNLTILDIGSRNSSLPAFLAWRGFRVTSCDKDVTWEPYHAALQGRWGVDYRFLEADVLTLSRESTYDAILSLFALQHAGEADRECHAQAARLLAPGGVLLSAVECNAHATYWDRGRRDGDLRIYGPTDRKERILSPLENEGVTIIDERFFRRRMNRLGSCPESSANLWMLAARKKA